MCGGFSPSHRTFFTTLPAKEEFACFRVAARVSEALRWSLEMSEGTWYGLTAWIEPQENKDTRGVRVRASPSSKPARGQHLITNKIYFFMRRLPAI